LQPVQVALVCDFFRRVGAYSNDPHPTPIELGAQFLQST
jgi:hypothetical protein